MKVSRSNSNTEQRRYQRGQTLVLVALLLPALVLILALVMDVAAITSAKQRLAGAAELAADAGATRASWDVFHILTLRHSCQPSPSFAQWDTPPCPLDIQTLANSADYAQLSRDCPLAANANEFANTTILDSQVLAGCLKSPDVSRSIFGWYNSAAGNLLDNQAAYDAVDIDAPCVAGVDGTCFDTTAGHSDCSSLRILCVQVTLTQQESVPVLGFLLGPGDHITLQESGFASISLPSDCVKHLVLGGDGSPGSTCQPTASAFWAGASSV